MTETLLFGLKSQLPFFFILSFHLFLTADRGDGEIQLEDEGADSDEEEEELENEEESLFDESKCYLRMMPAQNCTK